MKRLFLIFIFLVVTGTVWYTSELYRGWNKIKTLDLSAQQIERETLKNLSDELNQLPSVYPYTVVKKNVQRTQNILNNIQTFEKKFQTEDLLKTETIDEVFALNDEAIAIVKDTQSLINLVPIKLMSADQAVGIEAKKKPATPNKWYA